MAKKHKDLSGQLDGLFADLDSEEIEAKEELKKPQGIDELVGGEPAEAAGEAQPAAGDAQPLTEEVELPQAPAIDALLAAEPVTAEVAEEEVKPALAEEPAIEALLAPEPIVEEAGPAEALEPAVVEEIEVEPDLPEAVESPVAEMVEPEPIVAEPATVEEEPALAEPAEPVLVEETEPEVELPTMAELLAAEEAAPAVSAEVELEIPEPVAAEVVAEPEPAAELPTMAELLAAGEAAPAVGAEVEPEIPEPVAAEAAAEPEPVEAEIEEEALEAVLPSMPLDWTAMIREQRTKILNRLLLLVFGAATLVVAGLVIISRDDPGKWWGYLPYFIAWAVLAGITFARRLDPIWRTAGLVILAYVVSVVNLYLDGPLGAGWLYLLLASLLLSILVGWQAGVYAALGSFGVYFVFAVIHYLGWLEPIDTLKPENWTWTTVLLNMSGTFGLILAAATMVQWMFNSSLTTFLRETEEKQGEVVRSRETLRERAEELTAVNTALRRRTLQLETASQVSQAASSELDLDELVQQVVDLIHERFELYYVGLFLISETSAGNGADAGRHELVLKAGTGVAGRWMLSQGYKVEIGDNSAVGQCAARGQAQTSLNLGGEGVAPAGDLLMKTRSEIALPLRSRGRVLGALNVHSVESDAFSQEDVAVLQTMADQIAVTIDNAYLFAELRERLHEMEESQRLYVREQWTGLAPRRISPFYERARTDAAPLDDVALSKAEEVALQREMVVKLDGDEGTGKTALMTPITLRGQIIGALGLQEMEDRRQWTEDEIALIEAVADQMALAIENVRLLEETRQLAGWEQTLSDMTARFSRSLDTETLLQTAIQELGDLLQVDEVSVHIGPSAEIDSTGDEETA
jgi:GAF domain-containing protein